MSILNCKQFVVKYLIICLLLCYGFTRRSTIQFTSSSTDGITATTSNTTFIHNAIRVDRNDALLSSIDTQIVTEYSKEFINLSYAFCFVLFVQYRISTEYNVYTVLSGGTRKLSTFDPMYTM